MALQLPLRNVHSCFHPTDTEYLLVSSTVLGFGTVTGKAVKRKRLSGLFLQYSGGARQVAEQISKLKEAFDVLSLYSTEKGEMRGCLHFSWLAWRVLKSRVTAVADITRSLWLPY